MRMGILGGTFDPVHNGHMAIADVVRAELALDGIVLLPAGDPPHKRNLADKHARLDMVQLAAKGAGFEVCADEIERAGTTYTVDTLRSFHGARPRDEWIYIIGADTLKVLDQWREFAAVTKLCSFAVVHRPGVVDHEVLKCAEELSARYGARITIVSAVGPSVSSTQIRQSVARGDGIDRFVCRAVDQYICDKGLYLCAIGEQGLLEKLRGEIDERRYAHSLGVAQTAYRLAERYDISPMRARLAGLLHDCAKAVSYEKMLPLIDKSEIKVDDIEYANRSMLHAPVGAIIAAQEYGVQDAHILSAIRYHALGGANMSPMEALIYVADFIEPTREPMSWIGKARAAAEEDIYLAARICAEENLKYMIQCGKEPHPKIFEMIK